MYIEPNIESSYNQNNIGKTIYDITFKLKPNRVLEFGVLHGYSTICIGQALRDIGSGSLISYDLFETYRYNNSRYNDAVKTIHGYGFGEIINLKRGDFEELNFEDSFDLIHLDISNDGDKILDVFNRFPNSNILFEGGTLERDNVDWMSEYNKRKIYPLKEKLGYDIVNYDFPGLSLIERG
jgi:predicted O-methyltransferase YrrM